MWGGEDSGGFSKGFDQPAFDTFLDIKQPFGASIPEEPASEENLPMQTEINFTKTMAEDSDDDKEIAVVIK